MNMIKYFGEGRAAAIAVLSIIYMQEIGQRATAYSVARALDCSHPTARKLLRRLAREGTIKQEVESRENGVRVAVYTCNPDIFDSTTKASLSRSVIRYWSEKR